MCSSLIVADFKNYTSGTYNRSQSSVDLLRASSPSCHFERPKLCETCPARLCPTGTPRGCNPQRRRRQTLGNHAIVEHVEHQTRLAPGSTDNVSSRLSHEFAEADWCKYGADERMKTVGAQCFPYWLALVERFRASGDLYAPVEKVFIFFGVGSPDDSRVRGRVPGWARPSLSLSACRYREQSG